MPFMGSIDRCNLKKHEDVKDLGVSIFKLLNGKSDQPFDSVSLLKRLRLQCGVIDHCSVCLVCMELERWNKVCSTQKRVNEIETRNDNFSDHLVFIELQQPSTRTLYITE